MSNTTDITVECDVPSARIVFHLPRSGAPVCAMNAGPEFLSLPIVRQESDRIICDASGLTPWTPDAPVMHDIRVRRGDHITHLRLGYRSLRAAGRRLLLNGRPYYFRGYIRGIVAHDHPNLTGGDNATAWRKNILQARKYGFNLVRFHSTIPDEGFVRLADELGLLVHIEIGYKFKRGQAGEKQGRSFDQTLWQDTLKRFRNHPSVMIICVGNEMHNAGREPAMAEFYRTARALAPNVLMLDNTGWGEYDRLCTDLYAQHFAYYFPFKQHRNMFRSDHCWRNNGSVDRLPLETETGHAGGTSVTTRRLVPLRPVMAHEVAHYITLPDYRALNDKFDRFVRGVNPDYLAEHDIRKPKYLTELPQLIRDKRLAERLPDYIRASEHFQAACLKVCLEELRAAENICGFEMLQLSDCLKYENKNGLLDCFDDDKHIDPGWFRQFNADDVLLADLPERTFHHDQKPGIPISLSHFSPEPIHDATLTIRLENNGQTETIYSGGGFHIPDQGRVPLAEVRLDFSPLDAPAPVTLTAELTFQAEQGRQKLSNQWQLWIHPRLSLKSRPHLRLADSSLAAHLESRGVAAAPAACVFTDMLDGQLLQDLEQGRSVILNYNGSTKDYFWPGVFDRFKPCIWDRGHNLGGIIHPAWLRRALGAGQYFDLQMYDLVEAGWKINLDDFPGPVHQLISGVDKPVRDRMAGLIHKDKEFQPARTLRNFSYLFSLKVGAGDLIVCTFNLTNFDAPVVGAMLQALLGNWQDMTADTRPLPVARLRDYLEQATAAGPQPEDVMTRFWAEDNRPVEDQLFWEQAGVDLSKLR